MRKSGRTNPRNPLSLHGGRLYAHARGGWSDGLSDSSIGDLFGVNAVTVGDRPIDLWQLYYEQSFFNDRFFVRAGKIDLTGGFECADWPGSFDGNAYANCETHQFLNGALVNNPTIPFPDPGLSVAVHLEPIDGIYFSAAIADADADVRETGFNTAFHGEDNAFVIFEFGWMPKFHSDNGELPGGYRAGCWYDPQAKEKFDGSGNKRDDVGFYLSFDQMIYKETADKDDTQGAGLFARYGYSHGDVNEIRCFWSIGGQYQGLIPTRNNDVLGFGVAQGRVSPEAGFTKSHETAYELYYSIEVAPWLILTPSAQYIQNPGGDAAVDDAFVAGFRAHITF
jgi:porin